MKVRSSQNLKELGVIWFVVMAQTTFASRSSMSHRIARLISIDHFAYDAVCCCRTAQARDSSRLRTLITASRTFSYCTTDCLKVQEHHARTSANKMSLSVVQY